MGVPVASSFVAFSLISRLVASIAHLAHTQERSLQSPILDPWFPEPIPNVTVAEGRPVSLSCVVENLGAYRLAWIHKERHILLTLQDKVITRNPRVSIRCDPPRRTWWLKIEDVHLEDEGHYMCQVNTAPMKSQTGYLQVVVAPSIDEEWTSSDLEIREGSDIKMRCRATGSPKPKIHWRREHDRDIIVSPSKRVSTLEDENLSLTRTSRLSMGAYLCIASNGVQPSVSKRIMLNVLFPPMVLIPSQLIGASEGEDVSLICNLESNPRSITYWLLSGAILLLSNNKYRVLQHTDTSPRAFTYRVQMELKILDLRSHDFGSYTCVAKNSLGETQGTISLYEKPKPVTRASINEYDPKENMVTKEVESKTKPIQGSIKQDFVYGTSSDRKPPGSKYATGEALQRNKVTETLESKGHPTSSSKSQKVLDMSFSIFLLIFILVIVY